jgi:hypothetical protein
VEQEQGQDGDAGDRHPVVGGDHQLDETLEEGNRDHDQPDRRVPADGAGQARWVSNWCCSTGYRRAIGYERSDFRAILASRALPETRTRRWHNELP